MFNQIIYFFFKKIQFRINKTSIYLYKPKLFNFKAQKPYIHHLK